MPIRFPKMHIAESVINRILNVNDALDIAERAAMVAPPMGASVPIAAPSTPPGVEMEGLALNAQIQQPAPPDMAVPSTVAGPTAGGLIRGETISEGIP
jgi:hypothetical protein